MTAAGFIIISSGGSRTLYYLLFLWKRLTYMMYACYDSEIDHCYETGEDYIH